MLFEAKPEIDIHEQSPIALAFVGDGVFEVLVRARLVERTRLVPNRLHAAAVKFVSAKGQYAALEVIAPLLDEAERAVVRRGKNSTKATVAKHATHRSTGRPRRWNPCLAGCICRTGARASKNCSM
ncbi:MAG: ribonuclease III domain-containing protein [Ruthenibacterium lactatiformans]